MPSQFDYQNTDRENSRPSVKSVARDNDLKTSGLGSVPSIAAKDNLSQQRVAGSGAEAVTATIR